MSRFNNQKVLLSFHYPKRNKKSITYSSYEAFNGRISQEMKEQQKLLCGSIVVVNLPQYWYFL